MSPTDGRIEHTILIVLLQLVVIVAASQVFGTLFRRIGQPRVCGEIAAGLVLGPSLFGGMFPQVFHRVFDPSVSGVFSVLSQIGLILLMFLMGLDFDFGHLRNNRGRALGISSAGILLPFALGFVLGRWMNAALHLGGNWVHLSLFMAAAMCITAIPILGRIMVELNLNRTRIGSLVISAAAADDASGWIILAIVTALVRATFDPWTVALMVAETVGFAVVMVWVVRPLLKRWTARHLHANGGTLSAGGLALSLIFVLLAAAATNLIGIFSIFGAFFLGALLHDQHEFRHAIQRRLQDFVNVFFVPIFFTYTGLRTDIGTMTDGSLWWMCALVLVTAFVGKFGGCSVAARLSGLPWREASMIGVMMNTRALIELIVINIGYELGVIPRSVFFMLVFMAVVTTYVTTPVVRRLARSSEVARDYLRSEFAARVERAPGFAQQPRRPESPVGEAR